MLADRLSRLQVDTLSTGPHIVSGYGSNTNPAASTPSTKELGNRLAQLLQASLSATSLNTYRRPWQILQESKTDKLQLQTPLFPVSTHTLALFIAFLAEQKYAASTVASYISALSYPHRLASLFDPTMSEMIQLALRGYSKLNPSADSRLPIALPILEDIILACEHTKSSLHSRKLIQAMYAIGFFAALRVGEITSRASSTSNGIFENPRGYCQCDQAQELQA